MAGRRLTRALAALVLILAQAALGLPHRMMGEAEAAHVPMAGMAQEDCHHGAPAGGAPHSNAPVPPCGSCPGTMPGGCPDMASCGPGSVSVGVPAIALLSPVSVTEAPSTLSAPAAHDFVPDPPPPRA